MENNGGWKIILSCDSRIKEAVVHHLIFFGTKRFVEIHISIHDMHQYVQTRAEAEGLWDPINEY